MPPIECEIFLPVHNEGSSIEATIRGIYAEISKVVRCGFIVCEDGSKDDTKQVLRRLAEELPIRLNLSDERKGYARAVREGMAMTEAPYLLCLDSDGQCDPRDFASFWAVRDTADVIIGHRVDRADTLLRRTLSRSFYLIYQSVFRTPVHDPSCPYVLFKREYAHQISRELGHMVEGFWWEFVARTHRHGFVLRELPIHHQLRVEGVTQVFKMRKMPTIFFRHVWAIFTVWQDTRTSRRPSPRS